MAKTHRVLVIIKVYVTRERERERDRKNNKKNNGKTYTL